MSSTPYIEPPDPDEEAWEEGDPTRPGERTALAWVRTALLPAATGVAVLRTNVFASFAGHEILGVAYLASGIMVWIVGRVRFAVGRSARAPRVEPVLFGVIAGVSALLAVATGILLVA